MKFKLIAALGVLTSPAAAQAMPVQIFLTKADALQSRGPFALFSSDYRLLSDAIKADGAALTGERTAAKAAGRTPAYCPPGPIKMGSSDVLAVMRAIPAADRARTDTKDALRAYFARRYPCPR